MTTFDRLNHPNLPTLLTPEEQRAVWFLGALIRVWAGGNSTGGQLAILEHAGPRGYNSPLHRHKADEETFLILDGELRVEVGGQAVKAAPGGGRSAGRGPTIAALRDVAAGHEISSPASFCHPWHASAFRPTASGMQPGPV